MEGYLQGTIGFRIGDDFERVSTDQLKRLLGFGACVVSDAMKGFNAMDHRIRAVKPALPICGCAVTVRMRAGDNLMLHKAIELAHEGDILVLDTCGNYRNAVIGGIMSGAAFGKKKIGGLVVDGAVRDVEELREHGYPVYAAAIVTGAAGSNGPGEINYPVSCGEVPVLLGDIVVGDDNGVCVVPKNALAEVLEFCERRVQAETARIAEIQDGQLTGKAVLEKLRAAGLM